MPELHDLLDRRASGYGPPADLFERVRERRRRRDRNRRIRAGVLGVAVFALAAIGFVRVLGSERTPASDPVPSPTPPISGTMWPQSSLDEVREAQERADAGDPDYTWQVEPEFVGDEDPFGTEVSERFLHEGLGWEGFLPVSSSTYMEAGGPDVNAVVYLRCAPGRTNPLSNAYPHMPREVRGCAPTIDDFRYETVRLTVGQPARRGPSGIWVVTSWEMLQPAEQAVPPSDAEVTALLRAFLGARVDGGGAEEYLLPNGEAGWLPFLDGEAPLLHATTSGSRYERSEFERVQGPVWPAGWIEFKVRLSAEDGTVVEQHFVVVREENGRLGLEYGSASEYGDPATIENGQALYSLLDGEVTFAAASAWHARLADPTSMNLELGCKGTGYCSDNFVVVADPLPVETGCEAGPAPANADALARSIRSNPDLEATAPVAVSVGGIDALRMDVVPAPGADTCDPLVLTDRVELLRTDRVRLYLLDLPEGMSARILAIAIIARDPYGGEAEVSQSGSERVVEAATPIVDSFEFHLP